MDVVERERQLAESNEFASEPVHGFPVLEEDEESITHTTLPDEDPDSGEAFIRVNDRGSPRSSQDEGAHLGAQRSTIEPEATLTTEPLSESETGLIDVGDLVDSKDESPQETDVGIGDHNDGLTSATDDSSTEASNETVQPSDSLSDENTLLDTPGEATGSEEVGETSMDNPSLRHTNEADTGHYSNTPDETVQTRDTVDTEEQVDGKDSAQPEPVERRRAGMEIRALFDLEPPQLSREDLRKLLMWANDAGVSDIYLTSGRPPIAVLAGRYVCLMRRTLTTEELEGLLHDERPGAPADVIGGSPQDFALDFRESRDHFYRFRVNVTSCRSPVIGQRGIEWTLRPIPTEIPTIEELGVEQEIVDAAFPKDGLVLVTGPTGTGKSKLLASFMNEAIWLGKRVLTFEDPVEYPITSIMDAPGFATQSEVGIDLAGKHGNFAACIPNAMRRSPISILLGEARDQASIDGVISLADSGHTVYSTVHTQSVIETIRRMANVYEPQSRSGITSSLITQLRLIVHQRLVTRADDPDKRLAIREFLVFDRALRERLLFDEPGRVDMNLSEAIRTNGQTLVQDARKKFEQGLIDRMTLRRFEHGEING